MRKLVSVVLASALVSAAMAQSFTIRRPADGSTVRETVQIQIPKGAIPDGSYIGVIVNGKFLEAASPQVVGDNHVYSLNTKERHLPDGDLDIEVVLYMDFSDRAEIVNRSSVRVKLDNYTSIKVPDDGFELRYKLERGKEYIYNQNSIQSVGTVTQAQAQLGSRSGEMPIGTESVRMLYVFDNVYQGESGPEALLRIQALPDKGKNYTFLTTTGETEAKKYYDFQMHPLYMRITNTGREVWGAAPPYFPLEGTSGDSNLLDLYALLPLPVLPSKALFPGDVWQAQQLFSQLDVDKLPETNKLTTGLVSRGTFLGVEWEKGIPCAKFSVQVEAGPREMVNAVNLNNQPGEATRVSLEGIVYFALDRGIVVRSEFNMLQESLITVGTTQGAGVGVQGGGGGGNAGSGGGAGGAGLSGTGGGGLAPGFDLHKGFEFHPFIDANGQMHFFRQRGTRGGIGGPTGNTQGGTGGPGLAGRTGGGSGATGGQKVILRVRLRMVTELER